MRLGVQFRRAREHNGWTQKEIASRSGIAVPGRLNEAADVADFIGGGC